MASSAACSPSACHRYRRARRMLGTSRCRRWELFFCHTSYLEYLPCEGFWKLSCKERDSNISLHSSLPALQMGIPFLDFQPSHGNIASSLETLTERLDRALSNLIQ